MSSTESSLKSNKQECESRLPVRELAFASVTIVLWASAFAGIRAGLASYGPSSLALLRYLVASVCLGVVALFKRLPKPELRDVPGIFLMGFVGFAAYNVALNVGEVNVQAAVASMIVASAPIWMALLAWALHGERLSGAGWIGVLLSFAGVTLISLVGSGRIELNVWVLLVLLAAVLQASYSIGQRRLLAKYGPLAFTTYAIWSGTLLLLPFAPQLVREIAVASPSATWAGVYMGVFPGAVAYVSWSIVLSRLSGALAGSFLYLVPFFAGIIAWLWLGEVPDPLIWAGGALVILGVVVVKTRGRRKNDRRV